MNTINPKQKYHMEPDHGLLNDPVGLIWFKGRYHVFFQWNSQAKDHSNKEWGHFTSPDLVHWNIHESPLKPGQEYDLNGVYSGSSVEYDGNIYAYYTGNRKMDGQRTVRQCLAVSEDGYHFTKLGPVLERPSGVTSHFRDPRVLIENGQFIMLIGAQNEEKQGMILKFVSDNGEDWQYAGRTGLSRKANMIECPDLIRTENGDILLYCLQNRDPETDACLESISVCRILQPGWEKEELDLDTEYELLDRGFDSFAAQSLKAPDGRNLLFSWMNRLEEEQEKLLAEAGKSIHCLTLPREIAVENGQLVQKPAAELRQMFEEIPLDSLQQTVNSRCWMGCLQVDNQKFDLNINREIQLSWQPHTGIFTLFRKDWAHDYWQEKSAQLETLHSVQIFMDTSSIEVFLNDGQAVLSARILPSCSSSHIRLQGLPASGLQIYLLKEEQPFIHTGLSCPQEMPACSFPGQK